MGEETTCIGNTFGAQFQEEIDVDAGSEDGDGNSENDGNGVY